MFRSTASRRPKTVAEQAGAGLKTQIEQLRRDAAAREATIRAETTKAAETAMQGKLAEADRAKTAAVAELNVKLAEAQRAKETAEQQAATAKAAQETILNERLQEVREALEKDKTAAVQAEQSRTFEERQKLTAKVAELQRQLDGRNAQERGEGAERNLLEDLKAEFEDDRIRWVGKGPAGADIIHEIVHNGKVCGKIVYESKDRNAWRNEYVTKLRADQLTEKAEHAILSTAVFPTGARQLALREGVIVANPARVLALAGLLRHEIVKTHTLRMSNQQRQQKTAELYAFITSDQCRQLLDSIETQTSKLLELDEAERKAHGTTWEKRGTLLKSVQKTHGNLCFAFDRIIGTAEGPESA